ncbi:secreted RxLR effector protein 161-like [Arachis duranensis]|uniref:Secreted RxLR effector protein 161-like n=1 Tax=Arachis duranensis TaxID=130453 RepID=A0A6P4DB17_ARADU|nr:secreted RxLR effector protein 161-like [Arachis duranensis]
MDGCTSCHTLLPSTVNFSAFGGSSFGDPQLYKSIIRSLQFLTVTRPEISYSVNKLSQFVQAPLDTHWRMVKRIFRYLSRTRNYSLQLNKNSSMQVTAYYNSDWARDPDDRKSTSGYCVFLGSNLVSWASRKQTAVAQSEVEY